MKRFSGARGCGSSSRWCGVLLALQYLAPNGGYDEVETSQMNSYITKGQVKEITLIDGGDQKIKATLDAGVRSGGDKVTAHWLDGTQSELVHAGPDSRSTKGTIEDVQLQDPPAQPDRPIARDAAAVRR